MNTRDSHQRVQAFLEELTELTRRTGIVVNGCGHCDSPRVLVDGEPWDYNAAGEYVVRYQRDAEPFGGYTHTYAELTWVNPGGWAPRWENDRKLPGMPALRVEVTRRTKRSADPRQGEETAQTGDG